MITAGGTSLSQLIVTHWSHVISDILVNFGPGNGLSSVNSWPPIRRRYFQMHFREWKVLYFNKDFTEVCSWWSNWQFSSGLDNGLAPNRPQPIIWTNADLIHWSIYAALRGIWPNTWTNINLPPFSRDGIYIFQWNLYEIQKFAFNKMHLKLSSVKWQPFCSDLSAFTTPVRSTETNVIIFLPMW